jgi:TolA-binding protein
MSSIFRFDTHTSNTHTSGTHDKLANSKLSTLKKIKKAYNKEIPKLQEEMSKLNKKLKELYAINRNYNDEDYVGQSQINRREREQKVNSLESQLNTLETRLDKLEHLKKRVDPLEKVGTDQRNKLEDELVGILGKDPLKLINEYFSLDHIRASKHSTHDNSSNNNKNNKKPKRGGRTRKRSNKKLMKVLV